MTVLVTGGAGYIGSHLTLALAGAGRRVVVLDNLSTGFRWAVPDSVDFVEGCISDGALVRDLIARHEVDAVIHLAGSIVAPDSVRDPLGYYLNNTVRSRDLIASAVAGGVKQFVFSSTAAVYGDAPHVPLNESAALAPISPYGASKLMTERMLTDSSLAYGIRHVILRYFNVAGADPEGRVGQSTLNASHLIKLASRVATGQIAKLQVFGEDYPTADGTCVRDYIHVSDLAKAHVLALDYLDRGGADLIANCGYGRGASVKEVIASVKRVSGVDFPVETAPRREGDPASLVAVSDKARSALGWTPDYDDLDKIVAHALAWEKTLASRNAAA